MHRNKQKKNTKLFAIQKNNMKKKNDKYIDEKFIERKTKHRKSNNIVFPNTIADPEEDTS